MAPKRKALRRRRSKCVGKKTPSLQVYKTLQDDQTPKKKETLSYHS